MGGTGAPSAAGRIMAARHRVDIACRQHRRCGSHPVHSLGFPYHTDVTLLRWCAATCLLPGQALGTPQLADASQGRATTLLPVDVRGVWRIVGLHALRRQVV